MKNCPNCAFQNNPENQVCENCGLKFREFVTSPEPPPTIAPLPPLPEGSQIPIDHQKKFEELGSELEKFQRSIKAKPSGDPIGKEPQEDSSTWDEFLEKMPLGKTRFGQILKPILVGSTKPVGPVLSKILGQRWGAWSMIAALVASLSGVGISFFEGQNNGGIALTEGIGSSDVGILRWEGEFRTGESIVVERGQLTGEPKEAGKASVSGTWPVEPSCGLRPVTSGPGQIIMDQQLTTENSETFAFQVQGLKADQEGFKNVYFLWDCPKNKGNQE